MNSARSAAVARPSAHARATRGSASGSPGGSVGHLRARLEVRLAIGPAQVAQRVERPAVADRGQDVAELAVLRAGAVDVVGDDDRQPELLGEGRHLRDEPVVVGLEVVRQLHEEPARADAIAAPEDRCVALGDGPCPRTIADPQPARDLPVTTAGERDDVLDVLAQQGLAEPRHALGPGEVGMRHEPAEAAVADLRARQQHEMRATLPVADPAQVLLDRVAITREAGTVGAGAGREPRMDRLQVPGRGRSPGPPGPTGAGTTTPAGSGTSGSSSSISAPTTAWTPAASAADTNRTTPYSPS